MYQYREVFVLPRTGPELIVTARSNGPELIAPNPTTIILRYIIPMQLALAHEEHEEKGHEAGGKESGTGAKEEEKEAEGAEGGISVFWIAYAVVFLGLSGIVIMTYSKNKKLAKEQGETSLLELDAIGGTVGLGMMVTTKNAARRSPVTAGMKCCDRETRRRCGGSMDRRRPWSCPFMETSMDRSMDE